MNYDLFDRIFGNPARNAGAACQRYDCASRSELAGWFRGIADYAGKAARIGVKDE